MNALQQWMEKNLVPVAAKIGSQKHLVALRDSFVGMLPATMVGAIAALISAVVTTVPSAVQQLVQGPTKAAAAAAAGKAWTLANTPVFEQLSAISSLVNQGTLTIIGLIFAFSWGYNLSRAYQVNELAGGIVGVSALVAGLPNMLGLATVGISDKAMTAINNNIAGQGLATYKPLFAAAQLDAGAYFTVIIMGALATIIYAKLMLADLTIKMPDQVPPAVSKAFLAIIPTIVAVYIVAAIYYIVQKLSGHELIYLISKYIAEPFQALSQSIVAVLIVTFFVSLFWFFGIHGTNVLGAALDGIWGPLQLNNMDVYSKQGLQGVKNLVAKGATDKAHAIDGQFVNLWVRGSWDAYAWFGGTAGTITLIIAILWFSKREDYRTVAKLSLAPGIFNINEPMMFGMPLVLNSMFFIPLLLAPLASVSVAYAATALHLVSPVVLSVPWVTPPFINAFMATGFDWRSIVVTAVTFVISFIIWFPFVIAANSMEDAAE
ncbi:PTS sugar transporter subunit IIC [Lactococcus insecticola]|uniref:Permease IIC component n=1 Tax=Pseudolactococcus insecticola TaxID=2709158 RepID=A0A6A0B8B5_9LACT|nr:PTS sugar transporter subunit IIC [Lactococcus insecticola]GFH41096.1 PTS cellobiose transporter subunit IIC [Lactococcus insecticola]